MVGHACFKSSFEPIIAKIMAAAETLTTMRTAMVKKIRRNWFNHGNVIIYDESYVPYSITSLYANRPAKIFDYEPVHYTTTVKATHAFEGPVSYSVHYTCEKFQQPEIFAKVINLTASSATLLHNVHG